MNSCYIKTITCSPEIKVGDVEFNQTKIIQEIEKAVEEDAGLVVFPELCLTGATAGDLFYSKTLLDNAMKGLINVAKVTLGKNLLVFVGLPFVNKNKLYNAVAGISDGKVVGISVKENLSYYDKRYFSTVNEESVTAQIKTNDESYEVNVGNNLIYTAKDCSLLSIAVDVGEDRNLILPPSAICVDKGANIVVNPCAMQEFSGASDSRLVEINSLSKRLNCAYVCVNAGYGESTTDGVYSGQAVISEAGEIIASCQPFENKNASAEIDLSYIEFKKLLDNKNVLFNGDAVCVDVAVKCKNATSRAYNKTPFIVKGEEERLLRIQAEGLKKRIIHTGAQKVVLGLSGGLDSTLALIVAVKAMELAGKSSKDVVCVTMPCFGTSSRTFENSIKLAKAFNTTLKKVDITKAVKRHFKDIDHSESIHDAAYENSQARERTQILMDISNMVNGFVVGTGDLSELALGWATYNGDHMSMYAVNGSVPKTLVRHLVYYYAVTKRGKAKSVLLDVVDTPVSPELLPPSDGNIKQITEDIVGPYVLHDFFLYYMINYGFTPKKIFSVAVNTFEKEFDKATIFKWLKTFIRRFFTQQFKRSCLPDGVKVSKISLSPRGGLNMPSDAVYSSYLKELELISL